jgi:hypothetical protein
MQCAAYKELKPDPEISAKENGYIELKSGDDNFELKKEKKYVIKFFPPAKDNFYLVLKFENNYGIGSYLSRDFDKKEGGKDRIPDENAAEKDLNLYPVDSRTPIYYWIIDNVPADVVLKMQYRYAPQWRYQFETKYEGFKAALASNSINRNTYQAIGSSVNLSTFNYTGELQNIESKSANLQKVHDDLIAIEKIFPPSILNTSDEAYQNYVEIRSQVDDEISFQQKYAAALRFFQTEASTHGNTDLFVQKIPAFLPFFENINQYPDNIKNSARETIGKRLPEIVPYYEGVFKQRTKVAPLDINLDNITAAYKASRTLLTDKQKTFNKFVTLYNSKARALNNAKSELQSIKNSIASKKTMPENWFFGNISQKLSKLRASLPDGLFSPARYKNYLMVTKLNREINNVRGEAMDLETKYQKANNLVVEINRLKAQGNYREVRRLLKQNPELAFLLPMYKDLDQLSLNTQKKKIRNALANQNWIRAEEYLKNLHFDNDFLNPSIIKPKKDALVRSLEDTLFYKIKGISVAHAQRFMEENINSLDNIDELYNNAVFYPIYELTFSSRGESELNRRKSEIVNKLNDIRDNQFPTTAITRLYDQFTQNPNDNGVLVARAIVEHGKHYQGADKKMKRRIAECDPWASKWLTKARTYRKIYALPISSNVNGQNTYVFRINIRIPTEAKFPVYEVNIKLPKSLAKSASSKKWYEKMTMNKKLLKNEGRFSITAPDPANSYISKVAPLQVNKSGDNVLEVHFKANSFRVYEVSIMAQKPLMKKH